MRKDIINEQTRLESALLEEAEEARTAPAPQQLSGKVYNTDKTDTDLDSFSEAVRKEPKKSKAGLVVVAVLLLAVLTWYFLCRGGLGL